MRTKGIAKINFATELRRLIPRGKTFGGRPKITKSIRHRREEVKKVIFEKLKILQ